MSVVLVCVEMHLSLHRLPTAKERDRRFCDKVKSFDMAVIPAG